MAPHVNLPSVWALPLALESVWLLALRSTTSQLGSPWVLWLEVRWGKSASG